MSELYQRGAAVKRWLAGSAYKRKRRRVLVAFGYRGRMAQYLRPGVLVCAVYICKYMWTIKRLSDYSRQTNTLPSNTDNSMIALPERSSDEHNHSKVVTASSCIRLCVAEYCSLCTKFGQRRSYSAPHAWNQLDDKLKSVVNVPTIKTFQVTHFWPPVRQ